MSKLTLYPGVSKYPYYMEMDGLPLIVEGPREYPKRLNRNNQWETVDDARFRTDADRITKQEFEELVKYAMNMKVDGEENEENPPPTASGPKVPKIGTKGYAHWMNGTRVHFNDGEFAGMDGTIESTIPMRYRAEEPTYRIRIDGYPKPGGWDGLAIVTESALNRFAKRI